MDCLIIGAGVAGLSAARDLERAGLSYQILEARDRIGGRIFTARDERCPMPIELGAEFLHGPARETNDLIRAAGLRAVTVSGEHWRARYGRLRPLGDFFHDIDVILRKIDRRGRDESFADFIARKPGGRRFARQRKLAVEFIQGFHASDAQLISTHALAQGGSPGEDPAAQQLGRVLEGYDQVPQALAAGLNDRVHFGIDIVHLRWQRGRVAARAADGRIFEARTAVLTVPLGVLQAGHIQFEPGIAHLERGASLLAMGEALRIALLFRDAFWEEHAPELSFIHATEQAIPVWWTAFPVRTPLLIGWAGGPRARALSGKSVDELAELGARILAEQFGLAARTLLRQLEGAWTHDWQRDRYARGAYSYPRVGGAEASKLLGRSAARTVFFAGEAADPQGRNGTVDGAIANGTAVARRLIAALS